MQGIDNSSCAHFKFLCSLGEQLLKPNMLFWELVIPMAWICQLKMLWKCLVLQLRTKRSNGMTNHHKNYNASYVHAKEIEKLNNALNAIITCANNIQKNCFIAMTALKRRLKIEHFTEKQFLWKYDTFWLFLGYQDILILIFI